MESPGFASTRWTLVVQAGDERDPSSSEALSSLCSGYWLPLYSFARRQGLSEADAEDAVQSFFSRFVENPRLDTVDPARGRFRSWLLGAFRHHLSHERDAGRALKRGGGAVIYALDLSKAEERLGGAARDTDADAAFRRGWALALLDRVRERLRDELVARDRGAVWEVLGPHLGAAGETRSHGSAASALGMTEVALKVALHRMRRRFGQLLREEVESTLDDGEDLEEELRYLVDSL